MEQPLFRKKSLEHISSPQDLHDYMRVTSPRLWMILAVILALLVGFIIFAATATMENTINIKVKVECVDDLQQYGPDDSNTKITTVTAELPHSKLNILDVGMELRLGDERGTIDYFGASEDQQKLYVLFGMEHDYIPLRNAEYDAELVLESTTPINYLFH